MRSFGISRHVARIIDARLTGVPRAGCMVMELAGGRDPAKTIRCSSEIPPGERDGSYRRQELS